ncbi:hypothetical protein [Sinanaerobacter sp. ZZT-01]|uniref:hypothetical protein n=1 Tax=Sinanaerobacter sp. ZZT-01 TaxID=3111540 RepID=UPI002D799189|nr:hypothetical protein [Sinanaerobacter sp. ZZT-01]WRR92477.1 hypothetical protein U5921_10480 [Sinanaerobacter sp. ZZT-01]
MIKRMFCIWLSFIMVILSNISAFAAEPIKTEKHTRFVTGVTFIWCSKGKVWDPAAPMDLYTINTSAKLGKGAKNVKIYPYNRKSFDPEKATEGARERTAYDKAYMPYAGSELDIRLKTKPDENGEITYSYQFKLQSKRLYDVANQLRKKNEQEVRDLLGYVSPEMEKFFSYARNNTLADDTNGQLYFTPYIIEWDVTKCSVCGKCALHDGTKCSAETCDKWGTKECGCYRPPFVEPEQPTAPPDTQGCSSVIKWSETKAHTYYCSGCLMGGGCPGHTCRHVYTYQTALKTNAIVSPDELKSGYGFEVIVNNSISTGQISNKGVCGKSRTKVNEKKPIPPAAAEVKTGWFVKNRLGTQFKTIQLKKSSSTATTSKFTCAKNRISEIKERKIYTNVDLKGTVKKPVAHPISIVISGGGVNGIPFCKTIPKTITINGNMYEDDFTVDRRP